MVTDIQFEMMGVAVGQVASLRAAIREGNRISVEEEKKDRIENLMKRIRAKEKNSQKEGETSSKIKKKSKSSKSKLGKSRNINFGWLHRTSVNSVYKQVKRLEGASVRTVSYDEEKTEFTIDFLKEEACRLFFPQGNSKMGKLEDFKIEIGNFSQEPIHDFVDTKGNSCSYLEYLRDRGLYPCNSYIYLMTTAHKDKNTASSTQFSSDSEDRFSSIADVASQQLITESVRNSKTSENKDVNNDPVQNDNTMYGVVLDGVDVSPSKNEINIQYEGLTESSYSEVTLRCLSNSLQQCYWDKALFDPLIQEEGFENFCPLERGFTVTAIRKGDNCYIERVFTPCESSEESCSQFFFPCQGSKSDDIIVHHPTEIWGYDDNRLILGVVTKFFDYPDVQYIWYNNGSIVKEGTNLCCVHINEDGVYEVEVKVDGKEQISKQVKVVQLKNVVDMKAPPAEEQKNAEEPDAIVKINHSLPFIGKDQITITNEIGRGSFGIVFRGIWSGTDVAIKDIKVRNAKRLKNVVETKVQVHTIVRHPNITQIMAVSIEKNHVYIISEFIDGANLEELIFGENAQLKQSIVEKTNYIAKQVAQAVAYLHNLEPPIVHRDIKPANILVASDSCVTKLCDMGLSKLKSATVHAVTATGIPGTPHYMATECIVRKKKSDLHSDIWSLACTLLELLTQRDCWEDVIEESGSVKEEDDNYEVSCMMAIFQQQKVPKSLELLDSARNMHDMLTDCFKYEPCERPRAIDLVNMFSMQ